MRISNILTLTLVLLCPITQAYSQEDDSPHQVIDIKVTRERIVAYQESYDIAKKVRAAANGHIALGLRLIPLKSDVRMDDIHIWLEGENTFIPIKIREGSVFLVPIEDKIAAEKGHYSVNTRKGDLTANALILQTVSDDKWTIGLMKDVVAEANIVIKKVTPWYFMPFAPAIKAVAVCSRQPDVNVQIMDGSIIFATVAAKDKAMNDAGQPVFCALFNMHTEFKDDFHIIVPESAEVLLL